VKLSEATELRALWIAAEKAVATGQSYTIAGRSLTRVDAAFIASRVAYSDSLVSGLNSGRGADVRLQRVVPRDV
jgi:hypothetical protein